MPHPLERMFTQYRARRAARDEPAPLRLPIPPTSLHDIVTSDRYPSRNLSLSADGRIHSRNTWIGLVGQGHDRNIRLSEVPGLAAVFDQVLAPYLHAPGNHIQEVVDDAFRRAVTSVSERYMVACRYHRTEGHDSCNYTYSLVERAAGARGQLARSRSRSQLTPSASTQREAR